MDREQDPWPQQSRPDAPAKWNLRTEEEEYLNRLETKLERLKQRGANPSPRASRQRRASVGIDSGDEDFDLHGGSPRPTLLDDPGVHLLYGRGRASKTRPAQRPHNTLTVENALQLHLDDDDAPKHPRSNVRTPSPPLSDEDTASGLLTPENALQLHLDSPLSPTRKNGHAHRTTAGGASPPETPETLRTARVRFRSRVRIASGLHRAHARCSSDSSPSSSISAPLRPGDDSRDGEDFDRLPARRAVRRVSGVDERTPFARSWRRGAYMSSAVHGEYADDEDASLLNAARKTEEDVVFGRWPWRLANRHWWWWKIEPIACYCCAESSDESDPDD